jgi:adenine-specific DNA-methyltransferase
MSDEKIQELEQEIKQLKAKLKKRYGLVWEDKKEEFDKDSENALPILKDKNNPKYPNINTGVKNGKAPHILIEGDNYHTLSVLNYTHKGKIDLIYIDPPYNTSNKDFIYNDTFVDKEDSFRHSKWLSFMSKRLKLAKDLLTDDGVIFISIDDNEQAQLKLLCDEIFGERNFITKFIWEKTQHFGRQKINFYSNADYILSYAKKLKNTNENKKELLVESIKKEHEDAPLYNASNPKNILTFPIGSVYFNEKNNTYLKSTNDKYNLIKTVRVKDNFNLDNVILEFNSRWSQKTVNEEMAKGTTFWVKSSGFAIRAIYGDGKKSNESPKQILFTNTKNEFYAKSKDNITIGTSEKGSNSLSNIVGEQNIFEYPKPESLISYLISLSFNRFNNNFNKNATVLDFFAGSGTTGHAVLELNKQDGGNRQFILATNNENGICENITYERIKRVMQGYTTPKGKEVEGLGGELQYLKTDFIKKDNNLDDLRLSIVNASTTILCCKESIFNIVLDNYQHNKFKIFKDDNKYLCILFGEFLPNLQVFYDEFKKFKHSKVIIYAFVSDVEHLSTELKNIDSDIDFHIKEIPDELLATYNEIFGL